MPGKPSEFVRSQEKLLKNLLSFLNHPQKPHVLADSENDAKSEKDSEEFSERKCLEKFKTTYQSTRVFSTHACSNYFNQIFEGLVTYRLAYKEWISLASSENVLRLFACLRILLRDSTYQRLFFELGAVKTLAQMLQDLTKDYFDDTHDECTVDILKEMTNICQKLPTDDKKREWLIGCGVHKPLVMLVSARDVMIVQCSLSALIGLCESEKETSSDASKAAIGELNCTEILLRIVENYEMPLKKLSANLLRILCSNVNVREQVKLYDGIRTCLSLLNSDNVKFSWYLVWIIIQLSEEQDSSDDVRLLGGIPFLLNLLHKEGMFNDDQNVFEKSSESDFKNSSQVDGNSTAEILSLKSAVCTALTELSLNDANAQEIIQSNGLFLLSSLIVYTTPGKTVLLEEEKTFEMKKSALRALRYLFSMERNRQLFKILFPPEIFEQFIDVGHYVQDLNAYQSLVEKIGNLSDDQLSLMTSNIEATNRKRASSRTVGSYAVLELLGSGAFGSVYKVCKKNGDGTFFAMKEILLTNPNLGKTTSERNKSSGNIIQETKFLKEQLNHPNVVKYVKAFHQSNTLYVIMEYIDGAPLTEHFNSLKEKKEKFLEDRIWKIFIQIILGLRYLHKEKHIIHRDLTPNNVMLGLNDKVTITDLGLARQKLPDASELTSVVGTMLYWCPEILQHLPYGEKADIWAAGCLLYQMATLDPPFYSSNLLQLATKIVEADYEEIPKGTYSEKLVLTVERCITRDPKNRPDVIEVGSIISDVLMKYTDQLRIAELSLQKKLTHERKRTQRHWNEANTNMKNYHRLFWASQERSDKMKVESNSSGYHSLNNEDSEITVDAVETLRKTTSTELGQGNSSKITNPHVEACSSSSSEDILFAKHENESNLRSEDEISDLPYSPARHKYSRRPLALDLSSINSKAVPSLISPTLSPDPTKRRTQSSSSVEMGRRRGSMQQKTRPPTAAATLTISPRKVRQINDPILQILNQLHKIIFITQLPPSLKCDENRRVVEKFKRALFYKQTSSFNLKSEIKKVLEGSKEIIDLSFGYDQSSSISPQNTLTSQGYLFSTESNEASSCKSGITYEQMHMIVETVLMESGYYDVSPCIRQNRQALGPIGGLNVR